MLDDMELWIRWKKRGANLPRIFEMSLGGGFQFLLFLPGQDVEVNYFVFEDFHHCGIEFGEL